MPEEQKKLSVTEVRRTIATSLAAAFGFVIALLWSNVVMGGLTTAGVRLTPDAGWIGWAIFAVTALVLTVTMIVLIVIVSRWGSKG